VIKTLKKLVPTTIKRSARRVQTRLQTLGAEYYCPVCESRVNAFEPLPEFYTDNLRKHGWPYSAEEAETCNHLAYLCPFCQASDRDRLYAMHLRAYLSRLDPAVVTNIVDFAPSASLSKFIKRQITRTQRNVSYRTADAFAEGVDDKLDIADLQSYKDGQFDFFICSHVLEHVPDDKKAIRELYRILKPGGSGILMVPLILSIEEIDEDPAVVGESERWRRFGQFDHVRLYSKIGFLKRIREAGFIVHEYGIDSFGEQLLKRNGISNQSVLYIVEK
jgi:SAM-dependent methyltransferase